jgi:hypothetical protein
VGGGVVFRVGPDLFFLPASVATKVMPMPEVARVPGAPDEIAGFTLIGGGTVPVVRLGDVPRKRGPMLVVTHMGERIALVGLEIVATGPFEGQEAGGGETVTHAGRTARLFDVAALVAKVKDGRWAV